VQAMAEADDWLNDSATDELQVEDELAEEADAGETDEDTKEHAPEGNPEAAPGERAADVNDPEQDIYAVETTTVPEQYDDTDEAELAESEQQKHD
jgi:segregation and condensation protein B